MTVEPQGTSRRRNPQGDGAYQDAQTREQPDEQAELLRWRADQLLDEMMLGGVDVSAADLDGRPLHHDGGDGSANDHPAHSPQPHGSQPYSSQPYNSQPYSSQPQIATNTYTESQPGRSEGNGNGRYTSGPPSNGRDSRNGHNHHVSENHVAQDYAAENHDSGKPSGGNPHAGDNPGDNHSGNGNHHDTGAANGNGNGSYGHSTAAARPADSASPDSISPDSAARSPDSVNRFSEGNAAADQVHADRDLDIYFDAFEDVPAHKPATRPPLNPLNPPAVAGPRPLDARDSGVRDASEAEDEDDIFAPSPSWPEPRTEAQSEYRTAPSRPEIDGQRPGYEGEGHDSRAGREPYIPSKINDGDYLARRYGYMGDRGDSNAPAEREPYEDPLDRLDRSGQDDERAPGRAPRDSSRIYYERQRVDREERMRTAERRPDQPMHAKQGPDESERGGPGIDGGRDLDRLSDPRRERGRGDRVQDDVRRADFSLGKLDVDVPKPSAPEPVDTEWIHQAKEKWNWQDVSGVAEQIAPETSGAESLYEFELVGYDRDPRIGGGQGVGAMSVNGKKRSTLLPRMSSTSVDVLQERMHELHEQIAALLPVGHEYRERAYHLLEKANTILQHDSMRSAEVEYYLQQVRGIVQRQEHAIQLSSLYRQRLTLYLGAWLAFSGVSLLARYIFQFEFDAFLAGTFALDYSGFLLQNAAAFLGSLFAGALGGSIGALLTLARHARQPHGYVDRKYGLRGLILPIIGLLVGGLIYLPFALFYSVLGIDPSLNVVAASIAAICAFAFGFNQESLYGTRD